MVYSSTVAAQTSQATALQLPAYNTTISDSIIASSGSKWWKFDLKSGEGITATIKANLNAGQINLILYDEDTNVLAGAYSISNEGFQDFSWKAQESGTYYFRIVSSTSTTLGQYELAVYPAWYNTNVVDTDRNFYFSRETARYLSNGTYEHTADVYENWFRFTAKSKESVSVTITDISNTNFLSMELINSRGKRFFSSSVIQSGGSATINVESLEDGVYYVRVYGSSSGYYALSATNIEIDSDLDNDGLYNSVEYFHKSNVSDSDSNANGVADFMELNAGTKPGFYSSYLDSEVSQTNETSSATPIPYKNKEFNAEYSTDTYHLWKFEGKAQDKITVVLTPNIPSDILGELRFRVFNATNLSLIETGSYAVNGQITLSDIELPDNGTYIIQIQDLTTGTDVRGSYDLSIYKGWDNEGEIDSDRDFYHSKETAKYLSDGTYSFLSKRGVSNIYLNDYFVFYANAGIFNLSLTGISNEEGVSATLYYYDSNSSLSSISNIGANETKTLSETIFIPGYYYLEINGGIGSYGEYRLSSNGFIQSNQNSNEVLKRSELAKILLQKKYGFDYIPPSAMGIYTDVQVGDFNADWIEKLASDGITEGCATNLFCPNSIVTREQLSKLLLRTTKGSSYLPPTIVGSLFSDVDTNVFAYTWIEALRNGNEGLTEGCGPQKFCSKQAVTLESFNTLRDKAFP